MKLLLPVSMAAAALFAPRTSSAQTPTVAEWTRAGCAITRDGVAADGVQVSPMSRDADIDGDGDQDGLLVLEKGCSATGTGCSSTAVVIVLHRAAGFEPIVVADGTAEQSPYLGDSGVVVSGSTKYFWVQLDIRDDSEGDRARYFVYQMQTDTLTAAWNDVGHGTVTTFEAAEPPGSVIVKSTTRGVPAYLLLARDASGAVTASGWSRSRPSARTGGRRRARH